MVVDVNRKTAESFIFDGDYYSLNINVVTLQKWYLSHRTLSPEAFDQAARVFVEWKWKKKTDDSLPEIWKAGIDELAYAITKFCEDEVCDWDIYEPEHFLHNLKSYKMPFKGVDPADKFEGEEKEGVSEEEHEGVPAEVTAEDVEEEVTSQDEKVAL